jgi:hypothetical protein
MKILVITALVTVASIAAKGTDPTWEKNLSLITQNLALGMNTIEVITVLGDNFAMVTNMMDNTEVWRYDFTTEPEYIFSVPAHEDEVDTEGLRSGIMRMQVFVEWDGSGLLGNYTVYTGSGNGVISEYRVFADGTVRKSRF